MCILRGLLVILSVRKLSLAKINLHMYFKEKSLEKEKNLSINLHTFLCKGGIITRNSLL